MLGLNDRRLNWSKKSVYNFRRFMKKYILPYMGRKLCRDITESDITGLRAYIARYASKKNISPHSINRYIYSTRTVFCWGVTYKHIDFNPWPKYPKPIEKPDPPDLLTTDELKELMACAHHRI